MALLIIVVITKTAVIVPQKVSLSLKGWVNTIKLLERSGNPSMPKWWIPLIRLPKESNTLVIPSSVGDVAGMVATALSALNKMKAKPGM